MHGQLAITDGATAPYNPQNLVRNVFLGSGVDVSSIVLSGSPNSVGYFDNGLSEIGLERGIVLSTGRVNSLNDLNETTDDSGEQTTGTMFQDDDLMDLAGININDLAMYTIKFIPTSDTLRFNYVFASEEYPLFVCDINDVFGFFVNGPNPEGGDYDGKNIALIPEPSDPSGLTFTDIPVTINTVHDGTQTCSDGFPQYYNEVPVGTPDFQMNAYLDVFTAEVIVVPCEEYTIKLGVADASDNILNSAVFLEAKSFGTGTLEVSVNSLSVDGSLAEGCGDGELEFKLPRPVNQDFELDFEILSPPTAATATPGVDYPAFPDRITIPAGSNSVSIPLSAFSDGIQEGDETIMLALQVNVCRRDTLTIILRDDELFNPILPDDITICEGETLNIESDLDPQFTLPPPPIFTNDQRIEITPEQEAVFSDIVVAGVLPVTLTPNLIESVCITNLEHRDLTDLDIYLVAPGGQFLELSTDNGFKPNNFADIDSFKNTCFTPFVTANINNGNSVAGSIYPTNPTYTGAFAPEGVWSDIWDGGNPTNGTWRLMLIDDFNGTTGFLDGWSITFRSFYNLEYEWSSDVGTVPCVNCEDIEVNPTQETIYTLNILDSYGCERSESIKVSLAQGVGIPDIACGNITQNSIETTWNSVPNALSYEVKLDDGNWINVGTDLNYDFTNLNNDTEFTIQIMAIGVGCSSLAKVIQCQTLPCATPTVDIGVPIPTSCADSSDGSVTITASGLFPPFSYTIGGETNSDGVFSNVPMGDIVVIVSDAQNCTVSPSFVMPGPDALILTSDFSLSDPCNVTSDISGEVSVTGGTSPYGIVWEDGSTDMMLAGISPGKYAYTITDSENCTRSDTLTVPALEIFDLDVLTTAPLCKNEQNGMAEIQINSGQGPFNVQWPDNSQDMSVGQLEEGDYKVTVTDDIGCVIVKDFTVPEGAILTAELMLKNVTCKGQNDGEGSIDVMGGEGPYVFFWDSGTSNGNETTGLGPGSYNVFAEDQNGCRYDENFEITEPDGMTFDFMQINNLCNGTSNGRINISAQSPNGPVVIAWNDNSDQFERVGLASGEYCFTLSDGTSCSRDSCIIITEPDAIIVVETLTIPKCALGSDGSIELATMGGNGNYTYNWAGPLSNIPASNIITDLTAGQYAVTVADQENCQVVYVFELESNPEIAFGSLSTGIACFGDSTASIGVNATGGVGQFTYSWQGPNSFVSESDFIDNLAAGTYFLTYTDEARCQRVTSFEVRQPETAVEANISIADTICNGLSNGRLNINPSGGSAPYDIIWENGNVGNENLGLAPGEYNVTVTDSRACTTIASSNVIERELINVEISQTPSICFGTSDGSAEITSISYGSEEADVGNFEFLWNSSPVQTTAAATSLNGGASYSVVVTDVNGCTGIANTMIGSPEAVSANIVELENVKCFGGQDGSIEIVGVGGNGNYNYEWDANTDNQVLQKVENLRQGNYAVTISDELGCVGVKNYTVEQPNPLSMDFRLIDVNCYGESTGRAEAVVEGGVGPYNYLWTNNGREKQIDDVPSDQYNITVTDANGCILFDSTRINEPETPILVDIAVEDVDCFEGGNGKITIDAMGGSGFFQYSSDGNAFSSTNVITNLIAGSYEVYVRDFKGCMDTLSDVIITEPEQIVVDLGSDKVIPFGSTTIIDPQIFNSEGNLTFEWISSNLDLLSCSSCLNPIFEGQKESSFELIVYDEKGCQGRDFLSIRLENFSPLFVPTAFTPNDDEENDALLVFGVGITNVNSFQIFDRWGALVYELSDFQANDETIGWDGTFKSADAPSGLYYWFAEVEFANGFTETFNGNTTLLR